MPKQSHPLGGLGQGFPRFDIERLVPTVIVARWADDAELHWRMGGSPSCGSVP